MILLDCAECPFVASAETVPETIAIAAEHVAVEHQPVDPALLLKEESNAGTEG